MKKFINDPDNLTVELLEGLAMAYPDKVTLQSEKLVCRTTPKPADKVALLTLGVPGTSPHSRDGSGKGCWTSPWSATSSPHPVRPRSSRR